jgi:hypothetical protein
MEKKDDPDKPSPISWSNVMISPRNALTAATTAVGVSALVLPAVHSYPTVLSLLVALCAWSVVAFLKSSQFANEHFRVVWTAAVMLHLIGFFIPGIAMWLGFRNRKPVLCSALVCIWCLCYLVLLYICFPAPMGP